VTAPKRASRIEERLVASSGGTVAREPEAVYAAAA
jgi:hypothetical protein